MQELTDICHDRQGRKGAISYSDGLIICVKRNGKWTMHIDNPETANAVLAMLDGCRAQQACHGDETDLPNIMPKHAGDIRALLCSMREVK